MRNKRLIAFMFCLIIVFSFTVISFADVRPVDLSVGGRELVMQGKTWQTNTYRLLTFHQLLSVFLDSCSFDGYGTLYFDDNIDMFDEMASTSAEARLDGASNFFLDPGTGESIRGWTPVWYECINPTGGEIILKVVQLIGARFGIPIPGIDFDDVARHYVKAMGDNNFRMYWQPSTMTLYFCGYMYNAQTGRYTVPVVYKHQVSGVGSPLVNSPYADGLAQGRSYYSGVLDVSSNSAILNSEIVQEAVKQGVIEGISASGIVADLERIASGSVMRTPIIQDCGLSEQFRMPGDTYTGEFHYDLSTSTYFYFTENYHYEITNNYNYTHINYYMPGSAIPFQQKDFYFQLPDGRNSADLTAEEVGGLALGYDVVNYGTYAVDPYQKALFHFDGNIENDGPSSYDVGNCVFDNTFLVTLSAITDYVQTFTINCIPHVVNTFSFKVVSHDLDPTYGTPCLMSRATVNGNYIYPAEWIGDGWEWVNVDGQIYTFDFIPTSAEVSLKLEFSNGLSSNFINFSASDFNISCNYTDSESIYSKRYNFTISNTSDAAFYYWYETSIDISEEMHLTKMMFRDSLTWILFSYVYINDELINSGYYRSYSFDVYCDLVISPGDTLKVKRYCYPNRTMDTHITLVFDNDDLFVVSGAGFTFTEGASYTFVDTGLETYQHALYFDGLEHEFEIDLPTGSISEGKDFTFTYRWYQEQSTSTSTHSIRFGSNDNQCAYKLEFDGVGFKLLGSYQGSFPMNVPIPYGTWHTVTLVKSGYNLLLYLNGILIKSTGYTPKLGYSTADKIYFNLAADNNVHYLDEIMFANMALYTNENHTPRLQAYDTSYVLVVPDWVTENAIAVKSYIPVSDYRLGGVRPSYPSRGYVYCFIENNKIVSIQQYDDSGWVERQGMVHMNGHWYSLENFRFHRIADDWDGNPDIDLGDSAPGAPTNVFDFLKTIAEGINSLLDRIGNILENVTDTVGNILQSAVDSILGLLTDLAQVLVNGVEFLINGITSFISSILDGLSDIVQFVTPGTGLFRDIFATFPVELMSIITTGIAILIVIAVFNRFS